MLRAHTVPGDHTDMPPYRLRPPHSSPTTPVILPGNQLPIPSQDRLERSKRLDPHQHPSPQRLVLDRQTTPLGIGETNPFALEMFTANPVLFLKVLDQP